MNANVLNSFDPNNSTVKNEQNRNQAKYSSLFQFVKSLFQGKPVNTKPVYTHPTYLNRNKCVTINVNDLSAQAKQSYDALFDSLFSNVQTSKI